MGQSNRNAQSRKHRRASNRRRAADKRPAIRTRGFERLESRSLLAAYVVDTTLDVTAGNCGVNGVGNDSCSLRSAVEAANANPGADTITVPAGTHLLTLGEISISDDITIQGASTTLSPTVIDGNQSSRIFITSAETTTLRNLTLQNGRSPNGSSGGAIDALGRNLVITDSVFAGNTATETTTQGDGDGGAIAADGNLSISNTIFRDNSADGFGGAIYHFGDGNFSLTGSTLESNRSSLSGGAVYLDDIRTAIISASTFRQNGASNSGGAIGVETIETLGTRSLQVSDTEISSNTSQIDGGGIYLAADISPVNVSFDTTTIQDNQSTDAGGGVFITGPISFTQNGGTYQRNTSTAGAGGGIYLLNMIDATIDGASFIGNEALEGGGGAAILTDATILNALFDTNKVTGTAVLNAFRFDLGGGGIAIAQGGSAKPSVTIDDATIINNSAPLAGGIGSANANLTLTNVTIESNSTLGQIGGAGGVGFAQDDTQGSTANRVQLIIDRSLINNNTTSAEGGGVGVADADATITDTMISNNTANGGRGGGIGMAGFNNSPVLRLDRVTLEANQSSGDGGGIAVADGGFFLRNTTISNNVAGANGGGIAYASANTSVSGSVEFSTIASNRMTGFGANVAVSGSVTRFLSTIIADPLGGSQFPATNFVSAGPGQLSSQGFNLVSDTSSSFNAASDLIGVNPQLGGLSDNGGRVKTRAILAGSPAIDAGAGSPLAVDARGTSRPIDGNGDGTARNDIGAFEAAAISVTNTDLSLSVQTLSNTANPSPLSSVAVGDTFIYRVVVNNDIENLPSINDTASGVRVVTSLPAGVTFVSATSSSGSVLFESAANQAVATLGTVNRGTPVEISIVVRAAGPAPALLSSTSTVTNTPDTDVITVNDSATVTTNVIGTGADLQVSLSGTAVARLNEIANYEIRLVNNGPDRANGAQVEIPLITNVTISGVTALDGTGLGASNVAGGNNGQPFVVSYGFIESGATAVVRFSATSAIPRLASFSVAASSDSPADPLSTNNADFLDTLFERVVPVHRLSTGSGDGGVTLDVDSFGSFGIDEFGRFSSSVASFNPVGSLNSATVVFSSNLSFRSSTSGARQVLTPGQSPATDPVVLTQTVDGSLTQAISRFTVNDLPVTLTQRLVPTTDASGAIVGSRLVQSYSITNPSSTPATLDLARYIDADLEFDGSLSDGGGLLLDQNGDPTLFVTERGSVGSTDATFVGINASGGSTSPTDRFSVARFSELARIVAAGTPLDGRIANDLDGDNFVDMGQEYDVAVALRNVLSLAPGQSLVYETTTIFGSRPESVVPQMADVTGEVNSDLNGNGSIEPNERLVGVRVFVDANGNRLLDTGERSTLTDANGIYRLTGLPRDRASNIVVDLPDSFTGVAPDLGATRTQLSTGLLSKATAVVDVDGDGDQDILAVNELGNNVSVLLNEVGTSYTSSGPLSVGLRPLGIATWQPNLSSDPIIAVASAGNAQNAGRIDVIRDGAVRENFVMGDGSVAVAINDFNGDGQADYVAAALRSGQIIGRFGGQTTNRVLASVRNPRSVITADLNADGNADIVATGYGYNDDDDSEVVVLLSNGRGGFQTLRRALSVKGAVDVAVGNFDSDSFREIAVATYAGSVRVINLQGTTLRETLVLTADEGLEAIAAADINRDGLDDFIVANSKQAKVDLFINNANGFTKNKTITGVQSPADIAVGVLDQDQVPDVVVANLYQSTPRSEFNLPSSVTVLGLTITEREVTVTANETQTVNFGLSVVPGLRLQPLAASQRVYDVNQSGSVSALDALLILNTMSRAGAAEGESPTTRSVPKYADVNGDGSIDARDALLVINHLARSKRDAAQGELPAAAPELARRESLVDAVLHEWSGLF